MEMDHMRKMILIVDDDEITRDLVVDRLAGVYQTMTASNGQEATAIFAESSKSIDLVILDMHMPVMNGHDALMTMWKTNPELKAIFSSGYGFTDEMHDTNDTRVTHLNKPYSKQDLLETLTRAFS
jgi:DNA-binding NtrC family response regulator